MIEKRELQHASAAWDATDLQYDSSFRMLFDQAPVGMYVLDVDGRLLHANRQLCEMLGWSEAELRGTPCSDVTHPDDRAENRSFARRVYLGELAKARWEKRLVRRDGKVLACEVTLSMLYDSSGAPARFAGAIEDLTARKEAASKAVHSEALLRMAGETARLGGWACDFKRSTLSWSDEMCAIFEIPMGGAPDLAWVGRFFRPRSRALLRAAIGRCRETGESFDLEIEITTARGLQRWIRAIGHRDGDPNRLVGAVQCIDERKLAELELIRINRALHLRNGCNEVVIRATNERPLLAEICQLIVDVGGYRMAWVGFARDDERQTIEPIAWAGNEDGYVTLNHITWSGDRPNDLGSAGQTIRSGRVTVCEDFTNDPNFAIWREAAIARGYRSVIRLPLREGAKTFGVLCMYARTPERPPEAELELLQALADDIAFGVAHLRSQVERERIAAAVLKISAAVSVPGDAGFFELLARNMADAVGAQTAFIARYDPNRHDAVRTIAALVDGEPVENFEASLTGSPFEALLPDAPLVIRARLGERYPACPVLANAGAEACAAWRLNDSAGAPLAMMVVVFRQPLDDVAFTVSTLRIFRARAAAELERQLADARIADQASWLDRARDAIVVRDMDGRVSFWNKSAEQLYGWSADEACGVALAELSAEPADHLEAAEAGVLERGFWNGEIEHPRKDGSTVCVESRWTVMRDAAGAPRSILSIDTDITQRKRAEREIESLAFYDPLTSLPNRLLLVQRLKAALAREGRVGTLLLLDLDNFKALNETLGHDRGDELLQLVARRLQGCVRATDTLARFGGDEFVILLEDIGATRADAAAQARIVADGILGAFKFPYRLGSYEHACTPSIGIALFERHDSLEELLKAADLAMYQAKAAGRNTIRFFDPQMQTIALARRTLEDDMRGALRDDAFELAYHAQVDETGAVVGAEALVRWRHPIGGDISPEAFIAVAEDSGLIVPLGRAVLRMACDRVVTWSQRPHLARLKLSVNVSAREFRHPDFVRGVAEIFAQTRIDPRRLVLELTETVLVDDLEKTVEKMTALRALGVGFALDDFGTGYSSLSYLKRLPLDALKIDRSFVRDLLIDPNDAVIARTIVALGRSLSLDVVAEGVESVEQRDLLETLGCRIFQGFHFAKPMAADDFDAFVARRARTGLDAKNS